MLSKLLKRSKAPTETVPEKPKGTLHINIGRVQEVFETDAHGRVIPPTSAKHFNIRICCGLVVPRGAISFYVTVKILKADVPAEREAERVAIAWLYTELPRRFSRENNWDFFRDSRLIAGELPETVSHKIEPLVEDVELSEGLLSKAEEAIAHIKHVRSVFEPAQEKIVKFAGNTLPLSFFQTVNEAKAALRTIERVLEASGDADGFGPRRARTAMSDYEELASRRDESNHGYQCALTSFKEFASGLSFPKTWAKWPEI